MIRLYEALEYDMTLQQFYYEALGVAERVIIQQLNKLYEALRVTTQKRIIIHKAVKVKFTT